MKGLFVVGVVLFVCSCTSIDPYTGEEKSSNTAKGAGFGALAGAVIAAATTDDKNKDRAMLRGAAAGAAVGGGIGYYMDKQEAKLRNELRGTGVQVRREGNDLHLIMPGNITFQTSKYEIKSEFYSVLNSVAKVLAEFNKTVIKVEGHTDSTGSDRLNQTLSENRAESVKVYLGQRGVARGRIHSNGYGPRRPIATNSTTAGRQANRRVELKLEPIE